MIPEKKKIKVKIKEIQTLMNRLREINRYRVDEIIFLDNFNGEIKMDEKIVDDFKFTGLNSTDFIDSEFYKTGFQDIEEAISDDEENE